MPPTGSLQRSTRRPLRRIQSLRPAISRRLRVRDVPRPRPPIQPDHRAVLDDHLYLNNNLAAQQLWGLDRPGYIKAGNQTWPLIPKVPLTTR